MEGMKKKDSLPKSFPELESEINYFLACVDQDLYASPNNIISKKERSEWRFKVKSYYKELNQYLINTQEGQAASTLLIEIFKRLSYGAEYLKFSNWDTFRAIGMVQSDYYQNIMTRVLANGETKENIKLLSNLLKVGRDNQELSETMVDVFTDNVKNKQLGIEILKEEINELKEKQKAKKRMDSHEEYYLEKMLNLYTYGVLLFYLQLKEYNTGIKFFHQNAKEHSDEVLEYVLLEILEYHDLFEEWIKEYENHPKIDYRESLQEKYEKFEYKRSRLTTLFFV